MCLILKIHGAVDDLHNTQKELQQSHLTHICFTCSIQLLVIHNTTEKDHRQLQAHCPALWRPSSLTTRSCRVSQMSLQITTFLPHPKSCLTHMLIYHYVHISGREQLEQPKSH